MFRFFGHEACGVLAPQPGIEPAPPALEGEVLTTGLPGMSPVAISSFSKSVSLFQDLILTCLQEPKEVIQRPLEKSPFFSTVSPFLWPLFRQFWSQFLLHYQKGGPWKRWTLLLWRRPYYVSTSLACHLTLVYFTGCLALTWAGRWGAGITPKAASLSVLSFEKSILALVLRLLCIVCALNRYFLAVALKCKDLEIELEGRKGTIQLPSVLRTQAT